MKFRLLWLLPAFLAAALARPVRTAEATAEGVEFFEKKIRPVLVEQCFKCHTGAKPQCFRAERGSIPATARFTQRSNPASPLRLRSS